MTKKQNLPGCTLPSRIGAGVLMSAICFTSSTSAFESVRLVYDSTDGAPNSSNVRFIRQGDGEFFFRAADRAFGGRYLRSAGGSQNTVTVQTSGGFSLAGIGSAIDHRFLCNADSPQFGVELAIFDPRANTIEIVRDIEPGIADGGASMMTSAGDRWYFTSITSAFGYEFWQTDGTADGTQLVAEVIPGPSGFTPRVVNAPCALGNRLVYFVDDGLHGLEPWLFDGPAHQCRMIRDIATGSFDSYPPAIVSSRMLSLGEYVLFTAGATSGTIQVWTTDGTPENTVPLIASTAGYAIGLSDMFLWRGSAIFNARLNSGGPLQWFMSDGTPAGTAPIQYPAAFDSATIQGVFGFGNELAVVAAFQETLELWLTDLTSDNTRRILSGLSSQATFAEGAALSNGLSLFVAARANSTAEIWVTDGAEAGTRSLADITLGPRLGVSTFFADGSTGRRYLQCAILDSTMYFAADDHEHGIELWASDGTGQGTRLVTDLTPGEGNDPWMLAASPSRLFYAAATIAAGTELWTSDGTLSGSLMLQDIYPGSISSLSGGPQPALLAGETLILAARGDGSVRQIWRSDGSVVGTFPLLNQVAAQPYMLGADSTHAYFLAAQTAGFQKIWKTDGTLDGTQVIYEFPQNRSVDNGVATLAKSGVLAGNLFLSADPGSEGAELWSLNVATGQMSLVKDIYPGSPGSSIGDLTVAGDRLFFRAREPVFGLELWSSDGTADGTALVKDIRPGSAPSVPGEFAALNGGVVFTADDGVHGEELWVSDGTPDGTVMLTDIYAGLTSSGPGLLTPANGRVFFVATTPDFGKELWITDGNQAGTHQVRDILAGPGSTNPKQLAPLGDVVYFDATNSQFGRELWRSNGSAEGTYRVADIVPGPGSSVAALGVWEATAGDRVFFNADNIAGGPELWMLAPESSPDINADGEVDVQDLAQLLSGFGACTLDSNYTRTLDLDLDNCISLQDLAILLAAFGG